MLLTFLNTRPGLGAAARRAGRAPARDPAGRDLRRAARGRGAAALAARHRHALGGDHQRGRAAGAVRPARPAADAGRRPRSERADRVAAGAVERRTSCWRSRRRACSTSRTTPISRSCGSGRGSSDHPADELLTTQLFWKPTVVGDAARRAGDPGARSLRGARLVRDDLPALRARGRRRAPGDPGRPRSRARASSALRWRRYEIESYLVHPAALARFVEQHGRARRRAGCTSPTCGGTSRRTSRRRCSRDPLGDHAVPRTTRRRARSSCRRR